MEEKGKRGDQVNVQTQHSAILEHVLDSKVGKEENS